MAIENKIKQYRIDKGLSQNDLAEKLYVTRQAVSKWELGKAIPDIDTIKKLTVIFECNIEDLMELDNVNYAINYNIVKLNQVNRLQKIMIMVMAAIMVILLVLAITFPIVIMSKDATDKGVPRGVVGVYLEVNGDGKMDISEIHDKRKDNAYISINTKLTYYEFNTHNIELFTTIDGTSDENSDDYNNEKFVDGHKWIDVICTFTFQVKEGELPLIDIWELIYDNGQLENRYAGFVYFRGSTDMIGQIINDKVNNKGAYFYIKLVKKTEQTTTVI